MIALSFQDITLLWKEDKRKWVKPSTYATYVNQVNKHLLPYFGTKRAAQFSESLIQSYVDKELQDLSAGTIRDSIMILRMILRFGEKNCGWPGIKFDIHYPTSAESGRDVPVLRPSDQRKLLEFLSSNFSFRNLGLLICLHAGLRIGEVCALQWKDLDVVAGVIHVTKTVQRIWMNDSEEYNYTLSVGTPKTLTSRRDIPISRDLLKTIRPLRRVMKDEFYVVSNSVGPLEPRYYRDYFRKLLSNLNIPPARFHALRHSFATRCIESKCDYKTVSVILGHASLATTMDLYVHPGFEEKRRCINRMTKSLQL